MSDDPDVDRGPEVDDTLYYPKIFLEIRYKDSRTASGMV
jgi:hypothetical protein